MTTEEYIRHESFKSFGACVHEYGSDGDIRWYGDAELREYLNGIDWGRTAVLAHNAQFDVSIMEWVYDVRPAFIFDTLSMARALRGVEVGNSLARLAKDFGLPDKGTAVYSTNGVHELDAALERELAEYCKHDVFLCEEIFKRLVVSYPSKELRLIDMTLKMYTRALLVLDPNMLTDAILEEKEKREALLQKLGVEETALASNPQFAAILTAMGIAPPTKISKTTGKEAFALAKNDALFQALLNGEREDVALLCEARLRVKSTTERTRAQRFLDISQRGTLPVPLSYYGALSGRWTASKGSAINMQNLKRGSFLRKAIMAPKGHQLVVGDLSQIEPRVLAWLSDYTDMLDIFRAGGDPYAAFGAQMFNIPGLSKESHPDLRQSAKSALLGCFGADTLVLTKRGWVPIIRVQVTDMVWDGKEWVCHHGVVPQGEKEVLTAYGVSATSDHEILTEHGWVEWCAVLANPSLLKSGLSSVSLPVLGGTDDRMVQSGGVSLATNPKCGVLAGGKDTLTVPTYVQTEPHVVTTAQSRNLLQHGCLPQGMKLSAQTNRTATGYWTESVRSLFAATIRKAQSIQTTAVGALKSTALGLKTALSSYDIWSVLPAGTSLNFNLTEQTTSGGMSPETFGLSHAASTCRTSAKPLLEKSLHLESELPILKQRMQTYDIAYAGPRNRYTILTDEGPLVVHNCGYGLGWASFASQLLVGFLGAPPQRYDLAFAKKLGVTQAMAEKFLDWEVNVEKLEAIPHTCTTRELVIHCLAAKAIIDKYRATATPVVDFWGMCGELIESSLYKGKEYTHKCLTFKKGRIVLPSGMSLLYPDLAIRRTKDEKTKKEQVEWTYGENRIKIYAGKITNNVTQGVARCVMTDGMVRTAKRYFVAGTVHDEQIVVVPDAEVQEAKTWVLAQMTMEPPYMPGIPLDADGGAHRRYGLAKT
jgi:hypothetical protein